MIIRKLLPILIVLILSMNQAHSANCDELLAYVKSKSYGTTYQSYNSDAISKVTFYELTIDFQSHYFAVVCFKQKYYGCTEYIYQVSSNTKLKYSLNYLQSAGKAFWEFIQPYNQNLGCAPNFN